jgi:hypothetical protein
VHALDPGHRAQRRWTSGKNRLFRPFSIGNDVRLNDIRSVLSRPPVAFKLCRGGGRAVVENVRRRAADGWFP